MEYGNSNPIISLLLQQRQGCWERLTAIRTYCRFIMFLLAISCLVPNLINGFYSIPQKEQVPTASSIVYLLFARTTIALLVYLTWESEEQILSGQIKKIEIGLFRLNEIYQERDLYKESEAMRIKSQIEDVYIRSQKNSSSFLFFIENEPLTWVLLVSCLAITAIFQR